MRYIRLSTMVFAATVVLGLSAPAAQAVVVDNSQPPAAVFCSGVCGVGSAIGFNRTVEQVAVGDATTFTDVWDITLSEAGTIKGFLFANNTLNTFRLIDLNVTLEDGGGPVDPAGGYTVPNPPPFNSILQTAVTFANLSAGSYQFLVSGIVPNGQEAGQYQFQGEISAVPVPAAIWLFVSGILMLVGWLRPTRRQNSTA